MNRKIEIGIIVGIIVVIIAIGILMPINQNNNYPPTTTTTYTNTSVILNTNTTTSLTTTTSTTPTNVTTNTTTKIHYNTFYFLNQTGQHYYYVFVLNYSEYESIIENSTIHIITKMLIMNQGGIIVTQNIIVGNYVFLIGYTILLPQPLNVSINHQYAIVIFSDNDHARMYQFTYEGNWVGPLP